MKTLNRNIKISRPFQLFGMVCGLFLIASIFAKGSTYNPDNEGIKSAHFTTTQQDTDSRIFQDWESTLPFDFLSIISAGEEVDPTDESTGDETNGNGFPLHISRFNYNFLESSFASFNLSFQRRIRIPFFLLHHSWKIPFL